MSNPLKKIKNIKQNILLSSYTTLNIGGSAEYLYIAKTKEALINAIKLAHSKNIPITILGWGSNVLISDKGIKGLVIINKSNKIVIYDDEEGIKPIEVIEHEEEILARLDQLQPEIYSDFPSLDYDETNLPTSIVTMDSGVNLPLAIIKTIKADLTGMQWFAGIPGTIGGAVFNNIHGGTHFFSEILEEVEVLDKKSLTLKVISKKQLEVDYDKSIFQKSGDYILSVKLKLYHGDSEKAFETMNQWRKDKSYQPQNSPGSIWQNLTETEKKKLKLKAGGMGYIIDKILKLKGFEVKDAQISNKHAGFIVNNGKAKAEDVLKIIRKVNLTMDKRFGFHPKLEIFLLGFSKTEIKNL